MKRKIAIVASSIHPIRQKHLLDWYLDLSKESLNTQLFIGSKTKEIPSAKNYKINTKKEQLNYLILNLFKFRRHVSVKKIQPLLNYYPDIIHLLTSNAFQNILPILNKTNPELVVSFRGYDINVFPHESEQNMQLTQEIFLAAKVLHFVSNELKNAAVFIGADPKKCIVINRSIRIDSNFNILNNKNINPRPIIISVGRLVWEKGYLFALQALSIVKERGYDFEYQIIGKGIDYNMLKHHARLLNVVDRVFFLGELSKNEVKQLYKDSDIYFQPSVIEGIPNTILEASYYGLPIVSSDVGGIPEVLEHGFSGLLSSPCMANKFAENIIILLENNNLRIEIGLNAQKKIIKEFSRLEEIQRWQTLYNSIS